MKKSFVHVTYTSVHLNIRKTKQENLNEERNSDRHNEELNVAFILGAWAEWESISFEDIGVQGAKHRVTQSG